LVFGCTYVWQVGVFCKAKKVATISKHQTLIFQPRAHLEIDVFSRFVQNSVAKHRKKPAKSDLFQISKIIQPSCSNEVTHGSGSGLKLKDLTPQGIG